MQIPGIVFAVVAMLAWTFGDFHIHRATREIGVWRSIFWIGTSATILLFPWVAPQLPGLLSQPPSLAIILIASAVGTGAAFTNLLAWQQGKLAIIQPILGLEIVFAVILSWSFLHETLAVWQVCLVAVALFGFFLISTPKKWRNVWIGKGIERGVLIGLCGALLLGGSDLMVGMASRAISPLVATWSIHLVITLIAAGMILANEGSGGFLTGLRPHGKRILTICILDNIAWLSFAFALVRLPVAVATTIGLGYVPLDALLGVYVNKERLMRRQYVGIVCLLLVIFVFGITAA